MPCVYRVTNFPLTRTPWLRRAEHKGLSSLTAKLYCYKRRHKRNAAISSKIHSFKRSSHQRRREPLWRSAVHSERPAAATRFGGNVQNTRLARALLGKSRGRCPERQKPLVRCRPSGMGGPGHGPGAEGPLATPPSATANGVSPPAARLGGTAGSCGAGPR